MRVLPALLVLAACAPRVSADGIVLPDDADRYAPGSASDTDGWEPPDRPSNPDFGGTGNQTPDLVDPPEEPEPPGPPIVLAHGFFGFETFAGVGFLSYFYGVRDDLVARGEPRVFTPAVDPFADSDTRGAQLLAAIEDILAQTGADQVTLIAHSQGGLDARYVASERPDLVTSVTTIATPHAGTRVADIATGLVPFPGAQAVVDALVAAVAGPLWSAAGSDTSLFDSLEQLTTEGVADFVARHPDGAGVVYYSIGGRSDRSDGGSDCDVPGGAPAFITRWDSQVDPLDPLFLVTEPLIDGGLFRNDPNDGLVRVDDSKHGTFLGCIPADHLDEIGHLLGDGGGIGNNFDHLRFYRELVAWLRVQGH